MEEPLVVLNIISLISLIVLSQFNLIDIGSAKVIGFVIVLFIGLSIIDSDINKKREHKK